MNIIVTIANEDGKVLSQNSTDDIKGRLKDDVKKGIENKNILNKKSIIRDILKYDVNFDINQILRD